MNTTDLLCLQSPQGGRANNHATLLLPRNLCCYLPYGNPRGAHQRHRTLTFLMFYVAIFLRFYRLNRCFNPLKNRAVIICNYLPIVSISNFYLLLIQFNSFIIRKELITYFESALYKSWFYHKLFATNLSFFSKKQSCFLFLLMLITK